MKFIKFTLKYIFFWISGMIINDPLWQGLWEIRWKTIINIDLSDCLKYGGVVPMHCGEEEHEPRGIWPGPSATCSQRPRISPGKGLRSSSDLRCWGVPNSGITITGAHPKIQSPLLSFGPISFFVHPPRYREISRGYLILANRLQHWTLRLI